MFEQNNIEKLNAGIEGWNDKNKTDVISEMNALGIQHSKNSPNKIPLRKAFKGKLRKKFDLISIISYSMPRSAVFLHKGVSRGHGIHNPREAKEFYEPVVDKNIDDLANIVADGTGDLIVNALKIR